MEQANSEEKPEEKVTFEFVRSTRRRKLSTLEIFTNTGKNLGIR